jgi:acyl CoA:acetate/3-ketoacid CoA transferase beta subunit
MTNSPSYSKEEIMVVAASKEIEDNEVAIIGTGLPMIAAYLAKYTHAPGVTMFFESGIIDPKPKELATGVGDFCLLTDCAKSIGLYYSLSLLQRGYVDLGFLGAAEIDQFGNINSTFIGGNYTRPKVRLPGSGGANDIASLAKRVIVIVPHQKRKFPEKCQYVTTPGFLDGPGAREKAGLRGAGPARVITNLAVLGFDEESRRMKLETLHPGVELQEVIDNTGFELIIPTNIGETVPPTTAELKLLREDIDPDRFYIKG